MSRFPNEPEGIALISRERDTGIEGSDVGAQKPFSRPESTSLHNRGFPLYDKATGTRYACCCAVAITYVLSLVCIGLSIWLWTDRFNVDDSNGVFWGKPINLTPSLRIILDLVLNAVTTLCTEALAYVHSTSLRWAMWRSGNLRYGSNLRLFCYAPGSVVNSWYTNTLSAVALIITYASASQLLLKASKLGLSSIEDSDTLIQVNGVALLALGIGLLAQSIIAHACLWKQSTKIPTWSSNVMTIALACLHENNTFQHRHGRCMLPALHDLSEDPVPVQPRISQPSLLKTDPSTRHIRNLLYVLIPVVLTWAITIYVFERKYSADVANDISRGPEYIGLGDLVTLSCLYGLLFVAAFQAFATLALHCTELLVNRSRDEELWRKAMVRRVTNPRSPSSPRSSNNKSSTGGARKYYNSVKAAMTSWQTLSLFTMKALIHWLFGSSFSISGKFEDGAEAQMNWRYIIALFLTLVTLAIFARQLSMKAPKGFIPAAWGHLQTIVDLVDDWGESDVEGLYWGDKGENRDGSRHAGTSDNAERVGEIRPSCLYSGIVRECST